MYEFVAKPAFGRLAATHIGQYLLRRGLRWQAALALDRTDSLIVQVALSANVAHVPDAAIGLEVADASKRPVSVLSIASSMGLAKETTRRRAMRLASAGMLRVAGKGYIVPAHPAISGADDSLAVRDSHALYDLFTIMRQQGFCNLPAMPSPHLVHSGAAGRAILDFAARSMEGCIEKHGHITTGTIWAAIIAINTRPLMEDLARARAYAQNAEPLPDALRVPATLPQIAREVNLPRDTVRRHVMTLVRRGIVDAGENGFIAPSAALTAPEQLARSRAQIAHLRRLFDDVSRLSAPPGTVCERRMALA